MKLLNKKNGKTVELKKKVTPKKQRKPTKKYYA